MHLSRKKKPAHSAGATLEGNRTFRDAKNEDTGPFPKRGAALAEIGPEAHKLRTCGNFHNLELQAFAKYPRTPAGPRAELIDMRSRSAHSLL